MTFKMSNSMTILSPAEDPRYMRRIIAEDPEWNLATVPLLTELCLLNVVRNFAEYPTLHELMPKHKLKVLQTIAVDLPLSVTANLIENEDYWERCCLARWPVCDVSKYNHKWKRMYFERNTQELIEQHIPETSDITTLIKTIELSASYIQRLNIGQLLPPIKEIPLSGDGSISDSESDISEGPSTDHFDFNWIIDKLPYLEELSLCYRVKDCGMNFEWNLFEFTNRDCSLLAKALRSCKTLTTFQLHQSKLTDEKCRVLISHLLDHPSLLHLDLSHNLIGDSAARAIGKLLNNRCSLKSLNLSDNKIKSHGASAIANAIGKNTTLEKLNLKLNRIGDEGGHRICRSLLQNETLLDLNISSNDLGSSFGAMLCEVFIKNTSLKHLDLSCNKIGEDGGKSLQEGMEENSALLTLDLRLTEVTQASEYNIDRMLKINRSKSNQNNN